MAFGPIWANLPLDAGVPSVRPPAHYVGETEWNQLIGNFSAWADNVNAGGFNLSNLGLVTFGAAKYVNGTLPVGASNVDGLVTVGAAGALSGDTWSFDTLFGFNLGVRNSGAADQLYTQITHGSIGYSGIRFGSGNGGMDIYLESGATTAGGTVTPTAKIVLRVGPLVGIGTTSPALSGTGKLHVAGNTARAFDTARTIAASGDSGNLGEICFDDTYLYVRQSSGWRRVALGSAF